MSCDEPLEPDPANTGVGMGQFNAHFLIASTLPDLNINI